MCPDRALELSTTAFEDHAVLIARGVLTSRTCSLLREMLIATVGGGQPRVVVDVDQVELVDAAGLGVLVGGQRRAVDAGGCQHLVAPGGTIRRALAMAGLRGVLPVYRSPAEAVGSHRKGRVDPAGGQPGGR